ncbi:hypothetical protein KML24007_04370 [Alistipes indistinctus]|uniref:tetratricopeptide repeat protein n=1 Tax=Alistipes indistinctus TaxID=626932 RepID=UPI0036F4250A
MNSKYTTEELIDLYLREVLDSQDKSAFEKRIADDEDLRREVELTRHIAGAIERKGERGAVGELRNVESVEGLKHILNGAENKHRKKSRHIALRRWLVPTAAAVVVAITIIGLQPRYSTQELFSQSYITPAYDPAVSRGGEEVPQELKQILDQAGEAYDTGDMTGALALYSEADRILPLQDMPDDAQFYRAVALAEIDQTQEAQEIFSVLAADGESDYSEDAAWQMALLHLKNGERKNSQAVLKKIVASDGVYADDARHLLVEMRKTRFSK